jgi:hypothetical protein
VKEERRKDVASFAAGGTGGRGDLQSRAVSTFGHIVDHEGEGDAKDTVVNFDVAHSHGHAVIEEHVSGCVTGGGGKASKEGMKGRHRREGFTRMSGQEERSRQRTCCVSGCVAVVEEKQRRQE